MPIHHGRKAVGPGRWKASRVVSCSRALNQRERRAALAERVRQSRPGASQGANAAGTGRRSRVGAAERQGTSEVAHRRVGLSQPKGAGGLQPTRRRPLVFIASCIRRSDRSCRGEIPRHLEMGLRGANRRTRREESTQHADAVWRRKRRDGRPTRSKDRTAKRTGASGWAKRNDPAKGDSGNRSRPSRFCPPAVAIVPCPCPCPCPIPFRSGRFPPGAPPVGASRSGLEEMKSGTGTGTGTGTCGEGVSFAGLPR